MTDEDFLRLPPAPGPGHLPRRLTSPEISTSRANHQNHSNHRNLLRDPFSSDGRHGRSGVRRGRGWGGVRGRGRGRGDRRRQGHYGDARTPAIIGLGTQQQQQQQTPLGKSRFEGGDRIEEMGDPPSEADCGKVSIAIEGCCHGELDDIYERLAAHETKSGRKVDLLLCCGDFESIRNESDFHSLAVPPKYRTLGSFFRYYSGEKVAPVLTVFVGGNHEASQPLHELPYGGWVAPNIYYMGYANIISFRGVRIGGISGIYKSHDYRKGHFEKPPFDPSTVRSVYHVRNVNVHRLLCLAASSSTTRKPYCVDVMLSHDWPRGIERYGDTAGLLRQKPFFRDEIQRNDLGSPANQELLHALQPKWWFAAHLHVKFKATVVHAADDSHGSPAVATISTSTSKLATATTLVPSHAIQSVMPSSDPRKEEEPCKPAQVEGMTTSFIGMESKDPCLGPDLSEQMTRFLSLDKCLPRRHFLAIVHIPVTHSSCSSSSSSANLQYDATWLAVLCKTHALTQTQRQFVPMPAVEPVTDDDVDAILHKFGSSDVEESSLDIPLNFVPTVNAHDDATTCTLRSTPLPQMGNPQTDQFLAKLGLGHITTIPYVASIEQPARSFISSSATVMIHPPNTKDDNYENGLVIQAEEDIEIMQADAPEEEEEVCATAESTVETETVADMNLHTTSKDENEIDLDDDEDEEIVESNGQFRKKSRVDGHGEP